MPIQAGTRFRRLLYCIDRNVWLNLGDKCPLDPTNQASFVNQRLDRLADRVAVYLQFTGNLTLRRQPVTHLLLADPANQPLKNLTVQKLRIVLINHNVSMNLFSKTVSAMVHGSLILFVSIYTIAYH